MSDLLAEIGMCLSGARQSPDPEVRRMHLLYARRALIAAQSELTSASTCLFEMEAELARQLVPRSRGGDRG